MNKQELARHPSASIGDEPSMRRFEYAICALAGIAAFLLGLVR